MIIEILKIIGLLLIADIMGFAYWFILKQDRFSLKTLIIGLAILDVAMFIIFLSSIHA